MFLMMRRQKHEEQPFIHVKGDVLTAERSDREQYVCVVFGHDGTVREKSVATRAKTKTPLIR